MNIEEKYIREKIGQKNPFSVPEGYFDQLSEQVMAQLPERDFIKSEQTVTIKPQRHAKSKIVALRPWLYAAASVVIVLVMSLSYYFHRNAGTELQASTTVMPVSPEESYIDEAADYAMLDNVEIYAYLAEN
jgi:hypothetical protein